MPNIFFHTCSMKINISEQILPLLNIAANEYHLAKLPILPCLCHLFLSFSPFCFWFLPPLLARLHTNQPSSPNANVVAVPKMNPNSECFPVLLKKTKEKKDLKFLNGGNKELTWFTGKRLGCVITEDNRHRMLFCLPRHSGNVLDVVELSDLRRKGRVAAAHYMNEHRQQQQQQQQ